MVYIQYISHSLCLKGTAVSVSSPNTLVLFSPVSIFPLLLHYTCMFFFVKGISWPSPPAVCWLIWKKLHWQALSGMNHTRGGNLLKVHTFLKLIHAARQRAELRWCCDSITTCAEEWEQREGGRPMSICWLVQFACYSFLSGSAGASSATVPHSNKQRQFSSSRSTLWRAANYERENGTATSAARRRTDHPCQRAFSSISMARTRGELEVCLLKNSWPHVVVCLRVGRAAAGRQAFLVASQISLIRFFFLLLLTPLCFFYSFHQYGKHV